jgi:6-methylsalicylic acid synthase
VAAQLSPAEAKKQLEQSIKSSVASVLHISSPDDVDTHRPLSELGMDSVMTVSLRKQFRETFKITIPPTLIWAHPTVSHLTKWFSENAQVRISAPSPAPKRTQRQPRSQKSSGAADPVAAVPSNPQERKKHLEQSIKSCVASVLHLASPDDVDTHRPLSELGMDSVMTVSLRKQFRETFKLTIPPTLIWSHPTVSHLTKWFVENAPTASSPPPPTSAAKGSRKSKSQRPNKTAGAAATAVPTNPQERKKHLEQGIKTCVAAVLRLSTPDDVDPHRPLSELGMDSVMTVSLRKQFKETFKVTIPPTLIWAHPTVSHLTKWFVSKLAE